MWKPFSSPSRDTLGTLPTVTDPNSQLVETRAAAAASTWKKGVTGRRIHALQSVPRSLTLTPPSGSQGPRAEGPREGFLLLLLTIPALFPEFNKCSIKYTLLIINSALPHCSYLISFATPRSFRVE
jgi:hypothetical protein